MDHSGDFLDVLRTQTTHGAEPQSTNADAATNTARKPNPPRDGKAFLHLLDEATGHRNRHEVFRDFVTMSAISLHNVLAKSPSLEDEYLAIIARYNKEEQGVFPKLLGELTLLLDSEPRDVLGQLFMQLDLGNDRTGQFFTPPEISEVMARMLFDSVTVEQRREFVTLSEPACGAGGMVLAFAKALIKAGLNPSHAMWAECTDIDRTVALMCYVQLSMWHIPAVVIVGNSIARTERERFYTPAHHLGCWSIKLKQRWRDEAESSGTAFSPAQPLPHSSTTIRVRPPRESDQLGFEF
jgi:hypothetical protein